MKKIFTIFCLFIIVLFVCASCSCKKDDKISLQVGDMNVTTYKSVTMTSLNKMIDNDETFILFVYQEGCFGCQRFKPILENAIKERHLIVYAIDIWKVDLDHELQEVTSTPTIVLYDEGELELMVDPNDGDYFDDNESFLSFIDKNKNTNMPTLYYINKEQLDEKISNGENFIVYYSRSSCGDCSYLNNNYLRKYLKDNHNTKHFYVLEVDVEGIRLENGEPNADKWQSFKDNYGLSNVNNVLGHGVGYVPTFQYYEDGQIKDMMVYFNDCEYVLKEDNTYFVVVNNSYYSDNPYIGQTFSSYDDYISKLEGFYNDKLMSFLNTNLSKVD